MRRIDLLTEGWSVAASHEAKMLERQLADPIFSSVLSSDGVATRLISRARRTEAVFDVVYAYGNVLTSGRDARTLRFWPTLRAENETSILLAPQTALNDIVVVTSHADRDAFVLQGHRAEQVCVVPFGVQAADVLPMSFNERRNARATLGFDDKNFIPLNVSDHVDNGGADILIKAFAKAYRRNSMLRLLLRGEAYGDTQVFDDLLQKASLEDGCSYADVSSAIRVVPNELSQDIVARLYNLSDCFVSPHRRHPRADVALETLAAGLPAICTAGAGLEEIFGKDIAWHIDSDVTVEAGKSSYEPRLKQVTDALIEVAGGFGFDQQLFAAARMDVLRRFSWENSARRLFAVLTGSDERSETRSPSLLTGLTPRAHDGLSGLNAKNAQKSRQYAGGHPYRTDGESLSVVIQGPCTRRSEKTAGHSMDDAVGSIRKMFPKAQVIVSTWVGSDVEGLDADDVVLSSDPGGLSHEKQGANNFNRMLQSTTSGLAAASRPFCIKTRNDVSFVSNSLPSHVLARAGRHLPLERRIWCASLGSACLETYLRPFHPSDMVQYGLTDDLRQLWSTAPVTADEIYQDNPAAVRPRVCPEQTLFIKFLRNNGISVELNETIDGRLEIIELSIANMLATFDVFDESAEGVDFSPEHAGGFLFLRENHQSFEALRAAWLKNSKDLYQRVHRNFHARLADVMSGRVKMWEDSRAPSV
jgi:glycosyltransferase involved in cell wall biosynthesis